MSAHICQQCGSRSGNAAASAAICNRADCGFRSGTYCVVPLDHAVESDDDLIDIGIFGRIALRLSASGLVGLLFAAGFQRMLGMKYGVVMMIFATCMTFMALRER